jgi:thioredoxin reductase (NADPH)
MGQQPVENYGVIGDVEGGCMASTLGSTFDTRYDQMFPVLDAAEIGRLRRFGERRGFRAGERLVATGEVSPGMFVVVSGEVELSQHSVLGRDQPITTYGPGSFTGELAQLSGQPSLVDARATKPVDALLIPSRSLRDVLVAEAELGERIMRALILRRVGLLESGVGGPVIVGRAGNADVLRLAGFLSRNGHPHHQLDPDTDVSARTLVERFQVDAEQLPIVLCPNGYMLRNPSEVELARCLGLARAVVPTKAGFQRYW